MTPDAIGQGWTPRRVGRRILVLPEVDSTNSVALGYATQTDADGLAVLADCQTAGRGRQGRAWLSPRGASVLCSVLILGDDQEYPVPAFPGAFDAPGRSGRQNTPSIGGRLTLVSGVAACQAIRQTTEVTPVLKWPNDLSIAGRKVGGILIESRPVEPGRRAWVIGIGINCLQQAGHFPEELRGSATSLELESSHPVDRTRVAGELLRALDGWLATSAWLSDPDLHAAWQSYAQPVGRRVRLRCDGREYVGRTLMVEPSGGLIVQCDDGRQEWFDPMTTTLL